MTAKYSLAFYIEETKTTEGAIHKAVKKVGLADTVISRNPERRRYEIIISVSPKGEWVNAQWEVDQDDLRKLKLEIMDKAKKLYEELK